MKSIRTTSANFCQTKIQSVHKEIQDQRAFFFGEQSNQYLTNLSQEKLCFWKMISLHWLYAVVRQKMHEHVTMGMAMELCFLIFLCGFV